MRLCAENDSSPSSLVVVNKLMEIREAIRHLDRRPRVLERIEETVRIDPGKWHPDILAVVHHIRTTPRPSPAWRRNHVSLELDVERLRPLEPPSRVKCVGQLGSQRDGHCIVALKEMLKHGTLVRCERPGRGHPLILLHEL